MSKRQRHDYYGNRWVTETIRRQAARDVMACIPICEKDASLWLDQLLNNLEQYPIDVAWFLDNPSSKTLERISKFPQTAGWGLLEKRTIKFSESFRNVPLSIAYQTGAKWMLRMDSDELLEPNAWPLIEKLLAAPEKKLYRFRWYNVWTLSPEAMIRCTAPFEPWHNYRVVLHPLEGVKWHFKHGSTASAYSDKVIEEVWTDVRLLHYGFSTPELRTFHKARWDKLYHPNPHGMWNAACDKKAPLELYPWKPDLTHSEYCAEISLSRERAKRPVASPPVPQNVYVWGRLLETDCIEYDILRRAVREVVVSGVPGILCEVGTRKGGSLQSIVDEALIYAPTTPTICQRTVLSIDPYGDLPYATGRGLATNYGYTDAMRREALRDLYDLLYDKPVHFIHMSLDDTEYFNRFADGLPVYNSGRKVLENQYAMVFLDGPHDAGAVEREIKFFGERMPPGAQLVIDDIDWSRVEADKVFKRLRVVERGYKKARYVRY